jgi:hypothetical protein
MLGGARGSISSWVSCLLSRHVAKTRLADAAQAKERRNRLDRYFVLCVVAPLYRYAGKLPQLLLCMLQSVSQGSTSAGCELLRARLLG